MPYLKLFKACSDFALGFRTLNQARDNNDAIKDLYDLRHSLGIDGYSPSAFGNALNAIGRHDDMAIARTVCRFKVDATSSIVRLKPVVSGPLLGRFFFTRVASGQWRIYLQSAELIAAVALAEASSTVDRKVNCYVAYDPSSGPLINVSTWNIAGTPATADYDFSLVVWARLA